MKRKLSPWCKEVKKTLIDRDMSVTELCGEVGMCRNYVTTTINGRMYAPALDYMQFSPADQCSISGIEKGTFTCYEVKSCKEDVYSGNGLNFLGEKNYIVTTMECYKDILPDISSGKFAEHMRERFPESSRYFGVMVAIPDWAETTDEFEKPTPLDAEVRRWKLAVILPCRYGPRKRSMTELLFCMLRSGR